MKKTYTAKSADAGAVDKSAEHKETIKRGVEAATAKLLESIKAGKTDALVTWAKTCAQFYKYSVANQELIHWQACAKGFEPSFVASFKKWQEMGYSVRKGEKALWIRAPRFYKKEVEDKRTHEVEELDGVYFVPVPVFDAAQIRQEDGDKPLPQFGVPTASTAEASCLYELARRVATADGFACSEEELSLTLHGYSIGNKVVVRRALDSQRKFTVFVHELTHGLLHKEEERRTMSKRDKECEAEAVAFIVSTHFGIEAPFSSDYLLMYGNTVESVTERLNRIRETAAAIIDKIETARGAAQVDLAA